MLENAAESQPSSARFVGQARRTPGSPPEKNHTAKMIRFYPYLNFWQSPKLRLLKLTYKCFGRINNQTLATKDLAIPMRG